MCYSAMVNSDLKSLGRRFKARIDYALFETLFQRRVTDDTIKIPKALEANFYHPKTPAEKRIKVAINEYRARITKEWQTELFVQKKRLADAERKLKVKETKKALDDQRIATNKVAWYMAKMADLKRTDLKAKDNRIFPFTYAPVIVMENNEYTLLPARYHCRPNGKPAGYDQKYSGLYNARRDNLEGFWKNLFGHRHAILVATSFFENVALHDFEKRALRPGEEEKNVILHFNPNPATDMMLAGLWDRWHDPGKRDLYSFAVITDDPPPEVAATGHNRCIIPLKLNRIGVWMKPKHHDKAELYRVLDDRERPYYAHEQAA
ncbi:MAG: SOS response-associated peptidase family protein [Sulfuricaulis sp.]